MIASLLFVLVLLVDCAAVGIAMMGLLVLADWALSKADIYYERKHNNK